MVEQVEIANQITETNSRGRGILMRNRKYQETANELNILPTRLNIIGNGHAFSKRVKLRKIRKCCLFMLWQNTTLFNDHCKNNC